MNEKLVIITKDIYDSTTYEQKIEFDLKTGWLLYLYYKAYNSTTMIGEYELSTRDSGFLGSIAPWDVNSMVLALLSISVITMVTATKTRRR